MNAFDSLLLYYSDKNRLGYLPYDIEIHAQYGVAYLSPELCLLARPVDGNRPDDELIRLQSMDLTYNVNTWMIWIAAGDLSHCLNVMPYPLPFVAFQRNGGRLRRYNLKSLTRHGIFRQAKSTTEASTIHTSRGS